MGTSAAVPDLTGHEDAVLPGDRPGLADRASVLAVGPLPQAETAEITALLADSPERC